MGRFDRQDILDRSRRFALEVTRLVRTLPRDPVGRRLAMQLLDAATSVGANLHEADMAETIRDFSSKVNISQKEAGKSVYWLGLIRESGIVAGGKVGALEKEARELRDICRQIVYSTNRRAQGPKQRT